MNSPPLARSWCAEKPCQCNSTASTFLPERGSPITSRRLLPRPNQEAHLAGENSKEAAWGRKRSSHVCIGSRLCENVFPPPKTACNRGRSACRHDYLSIFLLDRVRSQPGLKVGPR